MGGDGMGTRPTAWGQGMRPPHRDKRHNFQLKPNLVQPNAHRHALSRFDTKLQIDKISQLDKLVYADAPPDAPLHFDKNIDCQPARHGHER
jgi:hypothetical protein